MNIILGRAQSGKTKYIMDIIKKNINNNNFSYIYIVPEFLSHHFERKLAEYTNNQSSFNGEVLSFRRLPEYISHSTGIKFSNKIKINSNIRILILKKILKKNNYKLKFYYNIYDKNLILMDILKIIDEFINYNLNIYKENIINYKHNHKIHDLFLIYKLFLIEMNKNFYDNKYMLTKFLNKIDNNSFIDNKNIFLDEFDSFTNQEYNIIKFLTTKTKNIYITINYEEQYKTFFKKSSDLIYQLKKISDNTKINFFYTKTPMFKSNNDIKKLENILLNNCNMQISNFKNINIHLSYNIYDECEFVACKIKELIFSKKYEYGDIIIASSNFSKYKSVYEIILKKFKIPFYIFEDNNIYENNVIKFLLSTIQAIVKNLNVSYIKQFFDSLLSLYIIDIKEFDNVLKLIINSDNSNLLNNTFFYSLQKLYLFTKNYYQKFNYFCNKLIDFLNEINLKKYIELLIKNNNDIIVAERYFKIWNLILDNLKQMNITYGEQYVNINLFYEILELIFKTSNINYIPPITNCVLCTNVERVMQNKVLFIIGCNNDEIPNLNKNQLFNIFDNNDLEKMNIKINYNILETVALEYENMYKLLTSAQNKIYISHQKISNIDNQYLYPSYIIKIINKYITNIKNTTYKELYYSNKLASIESTEELLSLYCSANKNQNFLYKINKFISNNNINLKILKFCNYEKKYNLSIILLKKIFSQNILTISASKLQILSDCKLKFFLKYILELKKYENEDLFSKKNIGSIKHKILEFINEINENNYYEFGFELINKFMKTLNQKCDNNILKIKSNEILTEFYDIFFRLKKMFDSINFDESYCEFKFNISNIININDININYFGIVDRVNINKIDNEVYFQIIDYKSNILSINYSDIINGYNLQIYFYLLTIYKYLNNKCLNKKIIPYGYLYIPLNFKQLKLIKQLNGTINIIDNEKMAKNILLTKEYYEKFQNQHNEFFLTKKIFKNKFINQIEMKNLLIFIDNKIESILKTIFEQNYIGNPMIVNNTSSCQYCDYNNICIFFKKYNRFYEKYDDNIIWEIINGKKMDIRTK